MLAHYGRPAYDGDCLYYRVNAISNETLGHSDVIAIADTIDQMDETLFALGEREQMAGYFSFDVTLDNATADDVRKRQGELKLHPPRRGSVNVHNNREHWQLWAPEIRQGGSIETVMAQLTVVCGALGFPVSWFGKGDETNRATAQAQADPTWRSLEHDRYIAKRMILDMLELDRDQAMITGKYRPLTVDTDTSVDLLLPEMTTRDMAGIAASLASLATALTVAREQKLMLDRQAREAWAKGMGELGVEVDVAEIEAEEEQSAQAGAVSPPAETVTVPESFLAAWEQVHAPFAEES